MLHSPFPVKVTQNYQLLCTSSQEPILVRGITSAYGQRMVQSSQFKISGLLQPFLVPKPHNHWRPILGLSKPNLSETIRTTLQQWEWVTSIDFKDAYFHIPIQEQSRTYQISCPESDIPVQSTVFGLSTAPMELTIVAKELKLMAIHKGIIIHQYLDDSLVKATSHQVCLQHTLDLVKICQVLGYQLDLMAGRVRPISDHWQNLQDKILEILSLLVCPAQQFMSDRFTNSHR